MSDACSAADIWEEFNWFIGSFRYKFILLLIIANIKIESHNLGAANLCIWKLASQFHCSTILCILTKYELLKKRTAILRPLKKKQHATRGLQKWNLRIPKGRPDSLLFANSDCFIFPKRFIGREARACVYVWGWVSGCVLECVHSTLKIGVRGTFCARLMLF